MYQISLLISALIANALFTYRPVNVTKTVYVPGETVTLKDERGFIASDVALIEQSIAQPGYRKGDALVDIAYRQGQWDTLDWIKANIVGRRMDDGIIRP